jgi:hypothetical protein
LFPQQSTAPDVRTAQYPPPSLVKLVAELTPDTGPGVGSQGKEEQESGPLIVPLPNWPRVLSPQQSTVPDVSSAQYPAPSLTKLLAEVTPDTGPGVGSQTDELQAKGPVSVPLPSSPVELFPQQSTAPDASRAQYPPLK